MNLLLCKHAHVNPTISMLFELHPPFSASQAHCKGIITAKVSAEKKCRHLRFCGKPPAICFNEADIFTSNSSESSP